MCAALRTQVYLTTLIVFHVFSFSLPSHFLLTVILSKPRHWAFKIVGLRSPGAHPHARMLGAAAACERSLTHEARDPRTVASSVQLFSYFLCFLFGHFSAKNCFSCFAFFTSICLRFTSNSFSTPQSCLTGTLCAGRCCLCAPASFALCGPLRLRRCSCVIYCGVLPDDALFFFFVRCFFFLLSAAPAVLLLFFFSFWNGTCVFATCCDRSFSHVFERNTPPCRAFFY